MSALVAVAVGLLARGSAAAGPAVDADPNHVDTDREGVARAYINALLSHDASAVRFAAGATRVEAGLKTGFSGTQMAWDLTHGPQYRVIQAVRELELSESGDVVTARFLLDAGLAGKRLMTVEITETFEIPDGTIHAVVARIRPTGFGS